MAEGALERPVQVMLKFMILLSALYVPVRFPVAVVVNEGTSCVPVASPDRVYTTGSGVTSSSSSSLSHAKFVAATRLPSSRTQKVVAFRKIIKVVLSYECDVAKAWLCHSKASNC